MREATEKLAEFKKVFTSDYSFDDLRQIKGPSGDTGLLLAAKSGHFDELALKARGGVPPYLTAEDLSHPAGTPQTVLSALARQKKLQQFFQAALWFPRKEDLLQTYRTLQPQHKAQINMSTVIGEMNYKNLRQSQKAKIIKFPKP